MKAKLFIIGLFLVALAACVKVPEHGRSVEWPSPELLAIDSLLWHQPDSALACLLPYFDTCCRDALNASPTMNASRENATDSITRRNHCVSTTFDRHYANLLLSELLYKNDYAQVNRAELLQAVAYFDSLLLVDGADTRGVSLQARPRRDARRASAQNIAFLDARAHYINGVGYYENDNVVEACEEYLKTLKVMEGNFEEKELVGKKAKFVTYTYNRLGDMFSEQFMMEPAIDCYEYALFFCKIEPTSPQGISNILYRLGKQYDKMGEKTKASDYYEQAIHGLPNNNSLLFRDLVSTKALCDYQLGYGYEQSLYALKQILTQADNESECLFRFLTIGGIFFEETLYDSALFYLEPVFENEEAIGLQSETVNYLHIIYDSLEDKEKADACARFLAKYKKLDWENKTLVSELEDLFKSYQDYKQKKQAEEERKKSIGKTIGFIVPIAILVALVIVIMAEIRSKKLLKVQKEEADRKFGESEQQHMEELRVRQAKAKKMLEDKEKHHQQEMEAKEAQAKKELEERDKRYSEAIEVERQTHRMEQAAISGRLKRSNQEVRELKEQIKQLDDLAAKTEIATSFNEEPICRLIMERVHDGQFKSKIDCEIYKQYALDKQQLLDLRTAADRHFNQFTLRLRKAYPKLTNIDIDYCCLYLLNLTYADVSALMQRAYNTVVERDSKIQKIFGIEKPLNVTLMDIVQNPVFI